jgi:hypothetical protein
MDGNYTAAIYSVSGARVYSEQFNVTANKTIHIDRQAVAGGFYILSLVKEGKIVYTQKLLFR